jgi:hypothetical protein
MLFTAFGFQVSSAVAAPAPSVPSEPRLIYRGATYQLSSSWNLAEQAQKMSHAVSQVLNYRGIAYETGSVSLPTATVASATQRLIYRGVTYQR